MKYSPTEEGLLDYLSDKEESSKDLQRYRNSSKVLMDLLWDDLNYVPEVGFYSATACPVKV
jgi:hypothetical protein